MDDYNLFLFSYRLHLFKMLKQLFFINKISSFLIICLDVNYMYVKRMSQAFEQIFRMDSQSFVGSGWEMCILCNNICISRILLFVSRTCLQS